MLHRRIIRIEHVADWCQFVTFHGGLAVTTIQLSALFLYQFATASSWCYFPMLSVCLSHGTESQRCWLD